MSFCGIEEIGDVKTPIYKCAKVQRRCSALTANNPSLQIVRYHEIPVYNDMQCDSLRYEPVRVFVDWMRRMTPLLATVLQMVFGLLTIQQY